MLIFPAIDLYGGEAVRLLRGDYDKKTVYSTDPLAVARDFAAAGAGMGCISLTLRAPRDGNGSPHTELICRIKAETGLRCEVGGGIRDISAVRRYLDAGIDRVILGTAAVTDPDFLREAARLYGEQIAVGVDLRDGYVAIKGWTETTERSALDFCREAERIGVGTLICTDISRDGAMRGTNRELYRMLSEQTGMTLSHQAALAVWTIFMRCVHSGCTALSSAERIIPEISASKRLSARQGDCGIS